MTYPCKRWPPWVSIYSTSMKGSTRTCPSAKPSMKSWWTSTSEWTRCRNHAKMPLNSPRCPKSSSQVVLRPISNTSPLLTSPTKRRRTTWIKGAIAVRIKETHRDRLNSQKTPITSALQVRSFVRIQRSLTVRIKPIIITVFPTATLRNRSCMPQSKVNQSRRNSPPMSLLTTVVNIANSN